jgi:hypothetical protein
VRGLILQCCCDLRQLHLSAMEEFWNWRQYREYTGTRTSCEDLD